jgi:hypothetical protein
VVFVHSANALPWYAWEQVLVICFVWEWDFAVGTWDARVWLVEWCGRWEIRVAFLFHQTKHC